jgi:hypothetical protein
VAWPFNEYSDVTGARSFYQITKDYEFFDLNPVCCVVESAGPESIT